jgi:hypothetical protein
LILRAHYSKVSLKTPPLQAYNSATRLYKAQNLIFAAIFIENPFPFFRKTALFFSFLRIHFAPSFYLDAIISHHLVIVNSNNQTL